MTSFDKAIRICDAEVNGENAKWVTIKGHKVAIGEGGKIVAGGVPGTEIGAGKEIKSKTQSESEQELPLMRHIRKNYEEGRKERLAGYKNAAEEAVGETSEMAYYFANKYKYTNEKLTSEDILELKDAIDEVKEMHENGEISKRDYDDLIGDMKDDFKYAGVPRKIMKQFGL